MLTFVRSTCKIAPKHACGTATADKPNRMWAKIMPPAGKISCFLPVNLPVPFLQCSFDLWRSCDRKLFRVDKLLCIYKFISWPRLSRVTFKNRSMEALLEQLSSWIDH